MADTRRTDTALRRLAAAVGVAVGSYAALVANAWLRYGHATQATGEESDPLLDGVMPDYEIVERHHVRVAAPVGVTFAAANAIDFERSAIARAIFKARELVMGSHATATTPSGSFLTQMQAIGWGELARTPGREVVMGAVTQPWLADVVFHPLPPAEFTAFREPGYVKIASPSKRFPADVSSLGSVGVAGAPGAKARSVAQSQ